MKRLSSVFLSAVLAATLCSPTLAIAASDTPSGGAGEDGGSVQVFTMSPSESDDSAEAEVVETVSAESATVDAAAASGELLIGMFFTSSSDYTDTLYVSFDGINFTRLSTVFADRAPNNASDNMAKGLEVDYVSCLRDPALQYSNGYYWSMSGYTYTSSRVANSLKNAAGNSALTNYYNAAKGGFAPMLTYSPNLSDWSYPNPPSEYLGRNSYYFPTVIPYSKDGKRTNKFDYTCAAPDLFIDDDGTGWIITCLGYSAKHNGDSNSLNDRMSPYIIKLGSLRPGTTGVLGDKKAKETRPTATTDGKANPINLKVNGKVESNNYIDASLFKDSGKYYLAIKKDGISNEIWETSKLSVNSTWTRVCADAVVGYEGATITKLGSKYYMFADKLADYPKESADGKTGIYSFWSESIKGPWRSLGRINTKTVQGSTIANRHGSVYRISESENPAAYRQIIALCNKQGIKTNGSPQSSPASIGRAVISGVQDKAYNGKPQTQNCQVELDLTTLRKGVDYTLEYKNNVEVGKATVTAKGKGLYTGSVSASFNITGVKKTPLSKAAIAAIANQTYTGKAITPKPKVTYGGKLLKEGVDYALSYKNNIAVGTATVTATGKGNYTGTKSATYRIVKSAAKWDRLWGSTQFDTMERIVQKGWMKNSGGTVIIATGANFPDALSAAGVAGLYGAPVLLTNKTSLPAKTKSELARIRPSRVIVAGGPGAIKTSVDAQIKAACGVAPTRCYGNTATDTAAKLATTYFGKRSSVAILATSRSFYDALAAAPVAYAKHYPIFLADNKDTLSRTTVSAMKSCGIKQVIVVGGEKGAISSKVVNTLRSNGIALKARLWGNDHYDTSREIAKWGVANGMKADRMGVATSKSYYDALCGAALCGKNNSVLVLADEKSAKNVNSGSLSFTKANKASINTGYVFGGWRAVSDPTFEACKVSTK